VKDGLIVVMLTGLFEDAKEVEELHPDDKA
jgi:hypothetical protein